MTLTPLGDQAVLVYFQTEVAAVRFAARVRAIRPPWLHDVVPAYASIGIYFDADAIGTVKVMRWLNELELAATADSADHPFPEARAFRIPVCYEMQLDMSRVREKTGLSADEIIRLHTAVEFTVYAVGFVPGFPYLGYLPPELCGVDRLASPRVRVEPGSVGLTGRQTGIYPLARPGGWNLIGHTPLVIVDVATAFFPFRVGDKVHFERIDERRCKELEGEKIQGNCQNEV